MGPVELRDILAKLPALSRSKCPADLMGPVELKNMLVELVVLALGILELAINVRGLTKSPQSTTSNLAKSNK